jgi:hypothetical protein
MSDTYIPLPPDPPQDQEEALQAVFTAAVVAIVMTWPETIPFVSVLLALLSLNQSWRG